MIKTKRLILREMIDDDLNDIFAMLNDEKMMKYYPHPYNKQQSLNWIKKNQRRYQTLGFGLWTVLDKDGNFVGDGGLTLQNIDGEFLPEIGYHVLAKYQGLGYGKEIACATRDWTFKNTSFMMVFSYMQSDNIPSRKTAESYGAKLLKEYVDVDGYQKCCYGLRKEDYLKLCNSLEQ